CLVRHARSRTAGRHPPTVPSAPLRESRGPRVPRPVGRQRRSGARGTVLAGAARGLRRDGRRTPRVRHPDARSSARELLPAAQRRSLGRVPARAPGARLGGGLARDALAASSLHAGATGSRRVHKLRRASAAACPVLLSLGRRRVVGLSGPRARARLAAVHETGTIRGRSRVCGDSAAVRRGECVPLVRSLPLGRAPRGRARARPTAAGRSTMRGVVRPGPSPFVLLAFGPILVAAFAWSASLGQLVRAGAIAELAGGLLLWTLLEYVFHRFLFHIVPSSAWLRERQQHLLHHQTPEEPAYYVVPLWISLPVAVAAWA